MPVTASGQMNGQTAVGAPTPPPPPKRARHKRLMVGAGVLVALAGIGVVLALTVFAAASRPKLDANARYRARLNGVFAPLLAANRTLSEAMVGLRSDRTEARRAVRGAQDASVSVQGAVNAVMIPSGSQALANHARTALHQEDGYLRAVDATLRDPTSPSAGQVQALGSNLVAALDMIDPPVLGGAQSVTGMDSLTSWAAREARETRRADADRQRSAVADAAAAAAARSTPAPVIIHGSSDDTGSTSASDSATDTYCGDGLTAGSNTSCGLARNVRRAYNSTPGTDISVTAFSPVTGRYYTFYCDGGSTVSCTGQGNDGPISAWW